MSPALVAPAHSREKAGLGVSLAPLLAPLYSLRLFICSIGNQFPQVFEIMLLHFLRQTIEKSNHFFLHCLILGNRGLLFLLSFLPQKPDYFGFVYGVFYVLHFVPP